MKYGFCLDDISDELWEAFSKISIGIGSHYCVTEAENKQDAAERIARALAPYLFNLMYESDDYGYRLE